ncbi:ATP-binding protein [Isoptericola sp. NPDC019571]|uniref:ATP-binding protein n=1 Tax=Isoptericola sp. NPDC019571 TaxID=3364008 RepID=UPI0037A17F52
MTTFDDPVLDLALPANGPRDAATTPVGEALFSIPGGTEGTTQWKVHEIQLINWGGFDGPTTITFDEISTLLSGASGSGKSTLLDAYTVAMMPTGTALNGASNAAIGRARGHDQRNVVSYVRGQTDETTDDDGVSREHVLRGGKSAAWGGVAVEFVDDHGKTFTLARLWYVPPTARLDGETTMRLLTCDGHLNLRDAQTLAEEVFPPRKLRALFPGITYHETYDSFAARLHTRLGIGANNDGYKALNLLYRVQSSIQFRTVDELYKETVLEQPVTFVQAEKALEDFGHLADAYRKMTDEARKESILQRIPEQWATLTDARTAIATLDELGLTTSGVTPLVVWETNREADLLEIAEADAFSRRKVAIEAEQTAGAVLKEAGVREDEAREEYNQAGGSEVAMLDVAIRQAELDATNRGTVLAQLTKDVAVLIDRDGIDLSDRAQFEALRAEGRAAVESLTARRRELGNAITEAGLDVRVKEGDLSAAKVELARLKASKSRISADLEHMRAQVCELAGLHISEAPFLAELVQVSVAETRWTTAIEKVLGPAGSRMIVPDAKLDAFQVAVNDLHLRGRGLRFDGAESNLSEPAPAPVNTTAGKLDFAPGRYRGWVMRKVAEAANNAVCVEDPADLGGGGYRVTLTGQTRFGRSGSLGGGREGRQLGFSNEDLREETAALIARLTGELHDLAKIKSDLEEQFAALDDRASAYRTFASAVFELLDVREAGQRLTEKVAARQARLDGNDVLAEAQEALNARHAEAIEAARAHGAARTAAAELDELWNKVLNRREKATRMQDAHLRDYPDLLDDETNAYLDMQFAAMCVGGDPNDLDAFPRRVTAMQKSLAEGRDKAATTVAKMTTELERTFDQFLTQFPSNTLTASLGAYHDFAQILTDITVIGLHERRRAWHEKLMEWSGQRLFLLHQAMDSALADIDDRLHPINEILATLPFGPTNARLKMRVDRAHRADVITFRRKLKELSSVATAALPEHLMETKFRELEAFMAKLRGPKDPLYNPKLSQRDDLLDVRRHVTVRAERRDKDGNLEATYNSLGSKSGGETQELIAFIVGAALRFRLGDEDKVRPRFAPVFLDEGFIKADAQFASRAVQAWTGLGFQLIVGAPMDKFAALEPHMHRCLLITKNQSTKKSKIRAITDTERGAVRAGAAK